MAVNFKNRFSVLRNSTSLTRPLFLLGTASALFSVPAQAFDANSLPQGATVTGGSATVAASGNTLTVNQSSNRAIIDWRSFDIGANAQANFNQPGTSSIAVNRVNGATDPSRIDGGLHANGQVWILNPNGVMFGKTARVDAAGIVATTANIDDKAFMAGSNKLQMTGGDSGQVVNDGHISVGQGGLAAFVAPSVRNSGVIRARVGKVTLAAGDTYTLDLAGDRLVELGLGAGKAVVDQSGKIVNPGGVIDISAKAAGQVVDSLINVSGVTSASSAKVAGGQIILGGDDINVASTAKTSADGTAGGQITAVANKTGNYDGGFSAKGTTGDGGQIETSGKTVHVASTIKVDTTSTKGKTGNWTLDPETLTVGDTGTGTVNAGTNSDADETISAGTVVTALNSSNVTLQANTKITVNSAINAAGGAAHNLTLADEDGGGLTIDLNAPITLATGGVLSGQGTTVNVGTLGLAQNGIDAALAGATVNLAAATYSEALSITKAVDIEGDVNGGTVIQPTALLSSSVGHKYASNAKVTVLVNGASGVTLNNLTINGNDLGNDAVVLWNNSSGSITNSLIENAKVFDGAQTGQGLGVDASHGNTTNLTVDHVTFQNFNKNAIDAVNGNSLTSLTAGGDINLIVENSSITGAGATNTIAQNGIVVWERGGGTINATVDNVSFSDLDYSAATSSDDWAVGVLQYGSPNGTVSVSNSSFTNVQAYISSADGSGHEINATSGNSFDGVAASSASADQLYAIEDKLIDGTNSAGDALVRIKAGNVYVTSAKGSIQNGINAASNGDTVNVQAGTYTGGITLNKANLTLESTTPQGAIIDAGGAPTAVSVSTAANLGTITIDGFTIQDWTSRGINQDYSGWTADTAAVHVTNNIVYGPATAATAHGNGIEVSGNGSRVTGNQVYNVHLNSTEWSGSGIIAVDGSNITIENNIVDGADTGIAVTNWDNIAGMSGIAVRGNTVSHASEAISIQTAEGEYFGTPSGPISGLEITDNTMSGNQNGIGVWDYSNAHDADWASTISDISGNIFSNNTTQISTDFTGATVNSLVASNTFDRTVVNGAGGDTIYGDLQTAIDTEAAGSTLNLSGTFNGGANINQAGDTLNGQGDAVINVNVGSVNALTISADNVTVENLEIAGPADQSYLTYAWGSDITRGVVVMNGVQNFAIVSNNIHGTRNDILLDGRNTGSVTGNTIDNSKSGISINYTDGSGIDISGNQEGTYGNEWGVNLHLNGWYDDLGNKHEVSDKIASSAPTAVQSALLALSAANGGMTIQDQAYASSNRTAVTVSATGGDANQGSPLNALASIAAGVNAVVAGGTVNVKDGSYDLGTGQLNIAKSLTLKGESVDNTVITSNSTGYGIYVTGNDVTLSNFTYNAPTAVSGSTYGIKVEPGTNVASDRLTAFDIDHVTINGGYRTALDLNGVDGATIDNVSISSVVHGNAIALTDSADVTITNTATSNDAWGGLALYQTNTYYDQQVDNISVDATNSFNEVIPVYAEDQSATHDFGSIALAGFDYVVKSPNDPNDVYSWFQKTQQDAVNFATDASLSNNNLNLATATVQGYAGSGVGGNNHFTVGTGANGTAMSVNVALDQSATGGIIDVLSGTYAEAVTVSAPRILNFDNADLDDLEIAAGGTGTTLSGSLKAGSVTALGDIALGGNLSIDTTEDNGTIALANVDGAHDLTLNAGSGVVLASGLGATTRLGAVDITADNTFLGATNKAASFAFNGDVTLSEAATVIDTTVSNIAAGDITFAGDIFGATAGAQSLTLSAGPGTGDASANGDITLNNAGISTVRLGSLTVTGNDFTALTVYLAGDFNATLTGNQVFAADTLNADGNVNSQVGGDATGHIVSNGNVNMNAGGDVSGTISGANVDLTAGNSVSGTISATNNVNLTAGNTVSGSVTGQTVSLIGQTVNTQVNAQTLNVNAPSGTITGTFTPGTVSNGLSLNGQVTGSNTNTGGGDTGGGGSQGGNQLYVNGQQLVVENFALPLGTTIGANGQLILPAGTVIGLLSPGGGPARVVMVSDVQTLGQLLSEGYVAIVIDLKGKKKAPVQVASN